MTLVVCLVGPGLFGPACLPLNDRSASSGDQRTWSKARSRCLFFCRLPLLIRALERLHRVCLSLCDGNCAGVFKSNCGFLSNPFELVQLSDSYRNNLCGLS